MGQYCIVELDVIEAADVQKRFQIGAAESVFMRQGDIKAGIRCRAFHVGRSQQEYPSGLQRLIKCISSPKQRVFRNVLDDVRHVDEVILLRMLAEKGSDVIFDFIKGDCSLPPVGNVALVFYPEVSAEKVRVVQFQTSPCLLYTSPSPRD